ncbi:methionine synthase [Dactylosporangium sp. NBC_01737]|uniref:methionine synthase n=1 Tax=Dactylosporangium sp. NBC_01737 TaxID=2975959 RepID=UPI002E112575|nr:methionine synthase [Dactylosporangium sp. NBC_01737]
MTFPWPVGSATGIGSMPGTDIAEAQRIVLGELPDLPYLPELPARGPGADMIGRGGALLTELPIELYAGRWRVASSPGHDLRVARDFLDRDLDTMTEQASEFAGVFKIQVPGPWTLAASLQLPIGGALLRDHGAARDLAASLADGVRAHVASVRARLPLATILLQVDEPSLPAVLAGRVPSESGYATLRSVSPSVARDALATVFSAASDVPVVAHCCAPDVPFSLLREAGAMAVALDLSLLSDLDALGEQVDAGMGVFAGVSGPSPAGVVRDLWRKLGFPLTSLAVQVVVTPPCGLSVPPVPVFRALRDAGRRLTDDL